MRNSKWKLAAVTGVALVAAGGGATGLAFADSDDPDAKAIEYVDGFNDINDDWNDHYEELGGALCDGCENSNDTDLVVMWQSVLAADGFFRGEMIDGDFGPDTAEATREWQGANDLEPTGEVNADSWVVAGQKLHANAEGEVRFLGPRENYYLQFTRAEDTDGAYTLRSVTVAGEQWLNEGGDTIELFGETIELKPAL